MAKSRRNYFINIPACVGIVLLIASQLHAVFDISDLGSDGPLKRRFLVFSSLPEAPAVFEAPPVVTVDPIAVACSSLEAALEAALKNRVNPLPIIDWLNVSNLPSFFDPTIRSLLKREEYYNAIDSLGKYNLGVQPYGLYSNYKLESGNFKLATFGVTVDGAVTFDERWVVGGGLGYWHSNLDWGKTARHNTVNTVYGGPFGGYVFDQAYIGLTLLGAYNMYHVNSLFVDGKNRETQGWDIGARLEGAYDYEWSHFFGQNFFIQPNGDISYLYVVQNKIDETKSLSDEEEFSASVGSRSYDFLRYRLGVTFKKEFHHTEKGILIPSLSIAWTLMQPLSASKISYTCGKSDEKTAKSKKYPSSNQLYLGAKIAVITTQALLVSLGADVYIANLYPVYAGNLRFEWNW